MLIQSNLLHRGMMWISILSFSLYLPLVAHADFNPISFVEPFQIDTVYTVYKLPKGFRLSDEDGGIPVAQCFNLEDYKVLLTMDSQLALLDKEVPQLQLEITSLKSAVKEQKAAILNKDAQVELLKLDRIRITKKWETENEKRHIAENRSIFGSWIPWTLAGVGTVAGLIAGVLIAQ